MPVTIGFVRGRTFAYHKRSDDGSAKADAMLTGSQSDRVWGVVYRIPEDQKKVLDHHESLGIGYDEQQVNVVHRTGSLSVWTYVARPNAIDTSLLPYSWYHQYVLQGARQHGLPAAYVDQLRKFQSLADPDAARALQNRQLIGV